MDRLFPLEVQHGRGGFLQAGSLRREVTIPRGVGNKGFATAELVFDHVHVPAANLFGGREGEHCDLEAGMAKLFATEICQEVALEAVRIHGGFGYTKEFNVGGITVMLLKCWWARAQVRFKSW